MGKGCEKIMVIVSCLECLTWLFLFLMVKFKSYYPVATEKWYSFLQNPMSDGLLSFIVTKVFQKGTMFKWVYVLVSDFMSSNGRRQDFMADWVRTASPSPQKKSSLFSPVVVVQSSRALCKSQNRPAARTGHFETEISSLPCIPFRDKLIWLDSYDK